MLIKADKRAKSPNCNFSFASKGIFGHNDNANFHTGVEHSIDLAFKDYHITVLDGGYKMNLIERGSNDAAAAMTLGADAGTDINPT